MQTHALDALREAKSILDYHPKTHNSFHDDSSRGRDGGDGQSWRFSEAAMVNIVNKMTMKQENVFGRELKGSHCHCAAVAEVGGSEKCDASGARKTFVTDVTWMK